MQHFLALVVLLLTCTATSAMAQERPRTRIILLESGCQLSVTRSPPVFLFVGRAHPGHELAALREDFTPQVVRSVQDTAF